MKTFTNHRAGLGVAACLAMFVGAFMIGMDRLEGPIWTAGLILWVAALVLECVVRASPYERIVRFSLPWNDDRPDLDERELGLRSRAYEASYVLMIFGAIVLLLPVIVYMDLKGGIKGFFLIMSFTGSGMMLPTIVLEWIAPASGRKDDLEET
ncbi:hypothetical protein [Sphingomonas sp. SUN039]|uniref:hypothetical protein n=1 Tax=Sphingomonas sp. SUN039 TaxID=2937787 RepID=UPI002164E382|nr:hypothetical protein [Sphingomonas sp. SUN039]UVO55214.1 hypothetical protein M0209_14160 [Sphingomonas sp. SUN039]